MTEPLTQFVAELQKRRDLLDDVIKSYCLFRAKLDSLPPDLAATARSLLGEVTPSPDAKESAAVNPPAMIAPRAGIAVGGGAVNGVSSQIKLDLGGLTALGCAKKILGESDNTPMHFSTIAKEAIARGYKGRSTGTPEEIEARIGQSFWAALSRSDEFEPVGKGLYRLRDWQGS